MTTERLTGYGELADVLVSLPLLVREARRARGLSLRAAATELGISYNLLTRMEHGEGHGVSSAVAALRWLDLTTPAPHTGLGPEGSEQR